MAPRAGGVYVDVTLGGGGPHRRACSRPSRGPASRLGSRPDRDRGGRGASRRRRRPGHAGSAPRSRRVSGELELRGIGPRRTASCADLGVSSAAARRPRARDELPPRGPDRHADGPRSAERPRSNAVPDCLSDDALADVIYRYGDEHRSRASRGASRGRWPTASSGRPSTCAAPSCARSGPCGSAGSTRRRGPSRRLRIAVNRELEELGRLISRALRVVADGRRGGNLGFHSLEDRLVKRAFHGPTGGSR